MEEPSKNLAWGVKVVRFLAGACLLTCASAPPPLGGAPATAPPTHGSTRQQPNPAAKSGKASDARTQASNASGDGPNTAEAPSVGAGDTAAARDTVASSDTAAASEACEDPTLGAPMAGTTKPPVNWWREFVSRPSPPPAHSHHVMLAPRLLLEVFGQDSNDVQPRRALRQNFGRLRMCYEGALASEPELAGHWVSRLTFAPTGDVCRVDVVDSNLPSEMIDCLGSMMKVPLHLETLGGSIEWAVRFLPPGHRKTPPPNHGRL